jgi:hypothetical protein
MPLVMSSSIVMVMRRAFWTQGTHRLIGADKLSLPCWTSCRITVAVKVFVMLPTGNSSASVSGTPTAVSARPEAPAQQPLPGTVTATAIPGSGRPGAPPRRRSAAPA